MQFHRITSNGLKLTTAVLLLVLSGCTQQNARSPEQQVVREVQAPPPTPRPVRQRTPLPPPPAPLPPPVAEAPRPVVSEVTIELGKSRQGRPIVMHEFGNRGPCLFVFGGIHGDEPTSVTVAEGLLRELRNTPSLYQHCRVAVITRANPDGLLKRDRRNAEGVDLNRNFPARNWKRAGRNHGSKPASEPETRALIAAMERLEPIGVISIHSIRGDRQCNNYDGPGKLVAEELAKYNGYRVTPTIGYATPGSFGSWSGHDLRIPTITLELPREQAGKAAWAQNREALLAVVRKLGRVAVGK